jgi:hypothetical protein
MASKALTKMTDVEKNIPTDKWKKWAAEASDKDLASWAARERYFLTKIAAEKGAQGSPQNVSIPKAPGVHTPAMPAKGAREWGAGEKRVAGPIIPKAKKPPKIVKKSKTKTGGTA